MEICKLEANTHLTLSENRKVTVSTSKKQGKTYRSYQINIPLSFINLLDDKDLLSEKDYKTKKEAYIVEIHKQHYQIKLTTNNIEKAIKITYPINFKKRTIALTLPKNDMEYIKAYDTFLDTVEFINVRIQDKNDELYKKMLLFKPYPLTVKVLLDFKVDATKGSFVTNLHIKDIDAIITDDFIEYVKKENNNIIPGWLDTLITDWENEYYVNIQNITSSNN